LLDAIQTGAQGGDARLMLGGGVDLLEVAVEESLV
jgi:hypothetical protein